MSALPAVIIFVVAGLGVLAMLRNELAYRIAMRAADVLRDYCEREVDRLDLSALKALWDRLDEPSYHAIMFDLSIWTWRQAYPWLHELTRQGDKPPYRNPPPPQRSA